jgi:trimethylamine--corrinoid protein Co-methyltransferase
MAVDWAGVLVGLVLSQLTREGAPIIIPGMPPGHMDMGTMVSTYAEPERGLAQALGHNFNLPMFSFAGVSEAKCVDQQAAAEAALTLMAETVSGGNIIHDVGYLESGLTFSFTQLAICEEMISWIKALCRKVDVSEEALALSVVSEVGPSGHFLNTQHTFDHFRKRWYPALFERANYESWAQQGETTLAGRAAARVEHILENHQPEELTAETTRKLQAILKAAERPS